jgi:hypothetical protein
LAVVRHGGTYEFLVNGKLFGSALSGLRLPDPPALSIGGVAAGGVLDEIQIWNRALSEAEIRAILVAGNEGQIKNPVISDLRLTANQTALLILHGSPNTSYVIETSADLVRWTPETTLLGRAPRFDVVDTSGRGSAVRFYRARRQLRRP